MKMKIKIVNKKKFIRNITILLIVIIAICISISTIKKSSKKDGTIKTSATVEEISTEKNEQESDNQSQEKVSDKNHLSETEASFGNLDVPVYKKSEKDLKIPLLIYHAFQTPLPENDVYKLFSTEERFEENVTALLNQGYTFLTLEDVYKYDKGYIGLPEKNITITMDDGWLGNYTEAFNVLKKYNIPATIFIVEELVGTQGYFTWEQAKEMYDTGLVKIHVHGRKHIEATGYTKEQLIADYNHAHQKIEEVLGDNVQKIMAYPAGKSSENTIK